MLQENSVLCSEKCQQYIIFGTLHGIIIYNIQTNQYTQIFQNLGSIFQIKQVWEYNQNNQESINNQNILIISYLSDKIIQQPIQQHLEQQQYNTLTPTYITALVDIKEQIIIQQLAPQPTNGQFSYDKKYHKLLIPYTSPSPFQYTLYKICQLKDNTYAFKIIRQSHKQPYQNKIMINTIFENGIFYINYNNQTCLYIQEQSDDTLHQIIKLQGHFLQDNKLYRNNRQLIADVQFNDIKLIQSNENTCILLLNNEQFYQL